MSIQLISIPSIQQAVGKPAGFHSDTVLLLLYKPVVMLMVKYHPPVTLSLEIKGYCLQSLSEGA